MLYGTAISTRIYQSLCKGIISPVPDILREQTIIQTDITRYRPSILIAISSYLFYRTNNSPLLIPSSL